MFSFSPYTHPQHCHQSRLPLHPPTSQRNKVWLLPCPWAAVANHQAQQLKQQKSSGFWRPKSKVKVSAGLVLSEAEVKVQSRLPPWLVGAVSMFTSVLPECMSPRPNSREGYQPCWIGAHSNGFIFFSFIIIIFWLLWVFTAAHGLSLFLAIRGYALVTML